MAAGEIDSLALNPPAAKWRRSHCDSLCLIGFKCSWVGLRLDLPLEILSGKESSRKPLCLFESRSSDNNNKEKRLETTRVFSVVNCNVSIMIDLDRSGLFSTKAGQSTTKTNAFLCPRLRKRRAEALLYGPDFERPQPDLRLRRKSNFCPNQRPKRPLLLPKQNYESTVIFSSANQLYVKCNEELTKLIFFGGKKPLQHISFFHCDKLESDLDFLTILQFSSFDADVRNPEEIVGHAPLTDCSVGVSGPMDSKGQ